ncbi:HEPN domain-containing protein [Flavobacterium sp. MFBS3-15]|uniref:HEPN domain-containing protein n=1 Tax=Flavobacterium sp. MFBS3-15 TaxID=2989816 RepID=UPI0022367DFC|nr:HEPN domain-containing protein [Flavobacterium sp. MFBS3-15]MCW4470065.1 HEPN domain-containing protein [Flavobacterium sp. MFBS3-15]
MENNNLYGGLSKIEISVNEFVIMEGIIIRKTYAHLFAPFMIAFSPPKETTPLKIHGDVKATKGGIGFDVLVEIEIQDNYLYNETFNKEEIIWFVTALLRLAEHPYIINSTFSDISFSEVLTKDASPTVYPNEIKPRIFTVPKETKAIIAEDTLNWLKEYLPQTLRLCKQNQKFHHALKAFDTSTISGKASLALISIWGAIEQLFSPNTGELKYRVSSNLAAYLHTHGKDRLDVFKQLSKLYNERSVAAHTSKDVDYSHVISSFVYFRNALIKVIEDGNVPSQEELEELIFKI